MPEARAIEPLPAAAPEVAAIKQDPLEAVWCAQGPEAVVRQTAALQDVGPEVASSEQAMRHALLRCEALLWQGQVETALDLNRRLAAALATPTPCQSMEPLVLEQHARLRMAGGETNMLKQEERLQASVEARRLLGHAAPAPALATLGALQKARGECAAALESYATALQALPDAPAWAALRKDMPWRMELLALAAMDRADCLATVGDVPAARRAAMAVAADLATVLGEGDPLAEQAADLRDRLMRGP